MRLVVPRRGESPVEGVEGERNIVDKHSLNPIGITVKSPPCQDFLSQASGEHVSNSLNERRSAEGPFKLGHETQGLGGALPQKLWQQGGAPRNSRAGWRRRLGHGSKDLKDIRLVACTLPGGEGAS